MWNAGIEWKPIMVFRSCSTLLFVFFILPTNAVGKHADKAICSRQCEKSATYGEGHLNHALLGHTITTLTTTDPNMCHYKCHTECRCLSYQISNDRCELLEENRFSKPASFQEKIGYKYYDIKREYYQLRSFQDGQSCLNTACKNGCCKSQPCLNNGRCVELCENPRQKFKCACPKGYTGKLCQIKVGSCLNATCQTGCCKFHPCFNNGQCAELCDNNRLRFNCECPEGYTGKLCQIKARSCKDYLGNGTNGKYVIFDKSGKTLTVFCDFLSEKDFAWTLIESFSFQNNFHVKSYPFFKDHPLYQTNPNWELYRLSYADMKDIADESTYFRATCQFPVEGVKYVDYVRGKLSDTNVTDGNIHGCAKYDYVNIRGHHCRSCTALTAHGGSHSWHLHIDGYYSKRCTLGQVPDALSGHGDDNFGFYGLPHMNHRCASKQSATTQWWLGGP